MIKNFDKTLPFTDDFIFSMVMQDKEICKGLLERILPDEEITDVRFTTSDQSLLWDDPLLTETQKTLKFGPEAHGVRFDAFIKSKGLWAEIEMQTYTRTPIGKRSRYYHANMDMDYLASGKRYSDLKKSYVIFICTYDYIGKGEPVYHFQNYDIDTDTYLDDDLYTIILNTSCPPDKVPDKLRPLYAYIRDSRNNEDDDFIRQLDTSVKKFNTPEWRKRQMTLSHLIEQEADKINQLHGLLIKAGRVEDLLKATSDRKFQKKLFEEFDL